MLNMRVVPFFPFFFLFGFYSCWHNAKKKKTLLNSVSSLQAAAVGFQTRREEQQAPVTAQEQLLQRTVFTLSRRCHWRLARTSFTICANYKTGEGRGSGGYKASLILEMYLSACAFLSLLEKRKSKHTFCLIGNFVSVHQEKQLSSTLIDMLLRKSGKSKSFCRCVLTWKHLLLLSKRSQRRDSGQTFFHEISDVRFLHFLSFLIKIWKNPQTTQCIAKVIDYCPQTNSKALLLKTKFPQLLEDGKANRCLPKTWTPLRNLHGTGGTLQTTEGERQTPALPKTL